mgnify:CR=1 FL=1
MDANFRKKHVGKHMMQELLENSKNIPVYGITNVPHVVHMFDELGLNFVKKNDINSTSSFFIKISITLIIYVVY